MEQLNVIVKFNISADEINELKSVVKDFFDHEVSKAKGFISAKFHESEDKTIFINYATWESKDSYELFLKKVGIGSEKAKKVLKFKPVSEQVYHISL